MAGTEEVIEEVVGHIFVEGGVTAGFLNLRIMVLWIYPRYSFPIVDVARYNRGAGGYPLVQLQEIRK